MKISSATYSFKGTLGTCGDKRVFLGFAPASILHAASFADILDEDTGKGYQRPRNRRHSLDFKHFITQPGSSTIPLTFNLRKRSKHFWKISTTKAGVSTLRIQREKRCLAQVDCQHRLGELSESDVSLAFMTFIGLGLRDEMAMFQVINSKAKGLSSSLTDYHESNLLSDLANEAPHLYIARKLNTDSASPWHRLIKYGGESTSGLKRKTSLRMMQQTVAGFLSNTKDIDLGDIEDKYTLISDFWTAVAKLFSDEWADHRHHLISKGVGLYALMSLLADIVRSNPNGPFSDSYFYGQLETLKGKVDWKSKGMFADAGGRKGAAEVHAVLMEMLWS